MLKLLNHPRERCGRLTFNRPKARTFECHEKRLSYLYQHDGKAYWMVCEVGKMAKRKCAMQILGFPYTPDQRMAEIQLGPEAGKNGAVPWQMKKDTHYRLNVAQGGRLMPSPLRSRKGKFVPRDPSGQSNGNHQPTPVGYPHNGMHLPMSPRILSLFI